MTIYELIQQRIPTLQIGMVMEDALEMIYEHINKIESDNLTLKAALKIFADVEAVEMDGGMKILVKKG